MKFDATVTLANLMVSDDGNLPNRLRERKSNLSKYKCKEPEIGNWLEDFELPVLIELLNSPDEYFFDKFPNIKSFTRPKRHEFAKEIQEHCKTCERCKLKVRYDSEWEKEVVLFVSNHKADLKKSLEQPRRRFFKTAKQ